MPKKNESVAEATIDVNRDKEERRKFAEEKQIEKEQLAKNRFSKVVKPLISAEASSFYHLGEQVERLFEVPSARRIRRNQKEIQNASLKFKESMIALSDTIKKISKSQDIPFKESPYIESFKKDIEVQLKLEEFESSRAEFEAWKQSKDAAALQK